MVQTFFEKFYCLSRSHERYRQTTERQTGDRHSYVYLKHGICFFKFNKKISWQKYTVSQQEADQRLDSRT